MASGNIKGKKGKSQAVLFIIFAFLFSLPLFSNLQLLNSGKEQTLSSYDYEITAYHVDMVVSPKNEIDIEEVITINAGEQMHGIVRALPLLQTVTFEKENGEPQSLDYKVKITNVSVDNTFETYTDEGIFYIRIGSEYSYVQGINTYTINYKFIIGDDRITEFDQFYYNIIGTSWDTTISNVSFKLTLPNAVEQDEKLNVYYGEYGSTAGFEISPDITGKVFEYSFPHTFMAFEGLSARIVFEQGYFSTSRNIVMDILILILLLSFIGFGFLLYQKFNNKQILVPVVNFTVLNNLPPCDVGYIIDGYVDNKDIASLIVYWAQKGFLNIVNVAKKANKEDFELVKVKDADESMTSYEKKIFDKIFNKDEVKLSSVGERIAQSVLEAKVSIIDKHEKETFNNKSSFSRNLLVFISAMALAITTLKINLYAVQIFKLAFGIGLSVLWYLIAIWALYTFDNKYKNGKSKSIFFFVLWAIILVVFCFVTYDNYADPFMLTFICILPSVISLALALKVNIRTKKGMEQLGHLLGFRQFIEFTEKDRIELLAKEDPQMFYNILPYAYVLGVSNIWINKFEKIVIPAPNWYVSNVGVFDYLVFRSMFNSIMLTSLVNVSYKPKVDSVRTHGVGGGFGGFGSGGGFSGGGFGGGGGGGW